MITLQPRDAAENDIAGGGFAVQFADDAMSGTGEIGGVAENADGSYSATFTGMVVGPAALITATLDGERVTSPSPTITVTADAISPATSEITVSSDSITVGGAATLTLVARDGNGNRRSTGGSVVFFSATGGTSIGRIEGDTAADGSSPPGLAFDQDDGTYTATFFADTPGTPTTIGATIDGKTVASTLPAIEILPLRPSPQTSVVTVDDSVLAAGESTLVRLAVMDQDGNPLDTAGLNITFSTFGGSSSATFDSTVDNGDGTYHAYLTGLRAGSPDTVTAAIDTSTVEMLEQIDDSTFISILPAVRVIPGAASPDSSLITASDNFLAVGDTTVLTLQMRDSVGNSLTEGGGAIVVFGDSAILAEDSTQFFTDSTTTSGSFTRATDQGDGTYTARFLAQEAGPPVTVAATIDGEEVGSWVRIFVSDCVPESVSFMDSRVTVNDSVISSGVTTTITLVVRDASGCPVPDGGAVAFAASGGTSTGEIGAITDQGNGVHTAGFLAEIAGTPTTITATIDSQKVSPPLPTIRVTPGDVSADTSLVTVSRAQVDSGGSSVLTLTTRDAAGNDLDRGGRTVLFTSTGGTSGGTISTTTDHGDGTYTAVYTGDVVGPGSPDTVSASIDGTPLMSTSLPTIEVVAGTISPVTSTVTVNGSAGPTIIQAGDVATLALRARDAEGRELVGGGRTVVFTLSGGTSDGDIGSTIDNDDGTYTATFLGSTAGSEITVGASIDGDPVTSDLPTVTVNPGDVSIDSSIVAVSDTAIAVGEEAMLTLETRDAFGNPLTEDGLTVVFTLSGGTSDGDIGPTIDNGDGTYTATFKGTVAGSPTTILVTIDGEEVTSPQPTITVTAQ